MQSPSDAELLAEWTDRRSEAAFARLVERYVALVHSAARRQVSDPHLAADITQAVFILLARKAGSLGGQTVLAGWLCRAAHFVARDALRTERRRQHREQLAATMDTTPDAAWQQLAPLLDEAVAQLRDADRNAIVLRYYEQRSLDETGVALGIGADAAQKRVARALEKLRGIFTKRGVTMAGAAIAGAVSANAIQAVPAGLAAKISAVAIVAGTTITSTTTIVMTTLQKTIIGATLAAAVGTGIYEAREASDARAEVQTLRQRQADEVRQLTRERDDATNLVVGLREDVERLDRNTSELLRLRGQVASLRQQLNELETLRTGIETQPREGSGALPLELSTLREFRERWQTEKEKWVTAVQKVEQLATELNVPSVIRTNIHAYTNSDGPDLSPYKPFFEAVIARDERRAFFSILERKMISELLEAGGKTNSDGGSPR